MFSPGLQRLYAQAGPVSERVQCDLVASRDIEERVLTRQHRLKICARWNDEARVQSLPITAEAVKVAWNKGGSMPRHEAALGAEAGMKLWMSISAVIGWVSSVGAQSPSYQMPGKDVALPGNLQDICYTDADLSVVKVRFLQQELMIATLQCADARGGRRFEQSYKTFLEKFRDEFGQNSRELQELAARKRFSVDVFVTELANRTAQQAAVDKEFCSRARQTFDWASGSRVTSLRQVPPPYDLGPEMHIFPCGRN